ncbi:MAG: DUF4142 domain-containing protein [Cyclobacteriaceae bacterium]
MKNIIKIKHIVVLAVCCTGLLFLASSCSDNKNKDSKEMAEKENIDRMAPNDETIVVVDNNNDMNFLMEAAEMQMEKINLGKLAQQKGNSSHVKELGKMMEEDHTKSLNELRALAQSKSISIPNSLTDDNKDSYEKLNDKSGNDFGKTYSDMMVDQHEEAIDLFETASTKSEDPQIRTWAAEKLPTLRSHLQHAEACKEKCKNEK